jgi:hypothetical protein
MSLLSKILIKILSPIYKIKAEKIYNSAEYQNTLKQIDISTKALNKYSGQLKIEIEKKNKATAELKKAGVKITDSMTPAEIYQSWQNWRLDRQKKFQSEHPDFKFSGKFFNLKNKK